MSTDIKSILINMSILAVLVFAIMAFIITTQVNNGLGADDRITNNTLINDSYGELELTLEESQAKSQLASNASEKVPPTDYVGDLDVSSTISTIRVAKALITGFWNIYIKLPMVILGVSPIVAAIISSILLILLVIGGWAIWKGAIS